MACTRTPTFRVGSRTCAAQQTAARFMALTVMNLVTPKAAAENELLFNKSTSGVCCSQSIYVLSLWFPKNAQNGWLRTSGEYLLEGKNRRNGWAPWQWAKRHSA